MTRPFFAAQSNVATQLLEERSASQDVHSSQLMLSTSMPHHTHSLRHPSACQSLIDVKKNHGLATVPPEPAAPRLVVDGGYRRVGHLVPVVRAVEPPLHFEGLVP